MKKTDKIKIICAVSAAAVICTLSVGVSYAYLGDTKSKDNKINLGHGDVSIIEEKSEPTELKMLNDALIKEYSVKNTGTVTSFARLYAEFSDSDIAEHIKVSYIDKNNEKQTLLWKDYKEGLKKSEGEEGYIESDWKYVNNDSNAELNEFFYYTKPLAPEAETPPLITEVILDFRGFDDQSRVIDNSNIDRISNVSKIVYAEFVQTVETGKKTVNGEEIYGYDYAAEPQGSSEYEWREAWISFLERN